MYQHQKIVADPSYTSKSKRGECKNCNKKRRDTSAYCQKCSDKFNKK